MSHRLPRSVALVVVLVLLPNVYGVKAAHANTDCGAKSFSGSLTAPAPGRGHKVELVVRDDCSVSVGPVQDMSDDEVAQAGRDNQQTGPAQSAEMRRSFSRIGSTPKRLDPDYHMDTHLWDCCNALLSHLVTDLSWTDDGSVITGFNSGGYTGQHPEFGTCGPGWQLVNSYLIPYSGGTGQSSVVVKSHGEWSYTGVFDCSGTTYYNIFEHYVYGYGSGASNCGYYWYLRATFSGFHLQVQCSSPLITLVDNSY